MLLEEGDDAAYDELLEQISAAIKPVDVIEEMFVADVVYLQWDILRLRRLKTSVIRATAEEALGEFLTTVLHQDLVLDLFPEDMEAALATTLKDYLSEDQERHFAEKLARQCLRGEPDAIEKANELLDADALDVNGIFQYATDEKVKELARAYGRKEPDAVKQVDEFLAERDESVQAILAKPLSGEIELMERVDRLIAMAEARRNASLREIDRRRALLGEALRRNMQELEHGEVRLIEPTR